MAGLLDAIPFSYNTLMFWGGVVYAIGFIMRQKTIKEFGGYGIVGGVIWYFLVDVLGLGNIL